MKEKILNLIQELRARSDNAYVNMIILARKKEALGWEAKVKCGEFGRPELDAHSKVGECLGRHRALGEASNLLAKLLEDDDKHEKQILE